MDRRGGIVAVAALVLVTGCGGDGTKGIRTATVGRGTVKEVVEAPGSITARASAGVTAPASGSVEALQVREGQRVRAGQVLLRIDSPDARRSLAQAKDADRQAASASRVDTPAQLSASSRAGDRAAQQAFDQARAAAKAIPDPATRAQALAAAASAQAQYATARAQAQQAVDNLNDGIGNLNRALSSLSAAQRVQTRAAVQLAQRAVDGLVVKAPIGGVVGLGATAADSSSDALSGALSQLPQSLQGAAGSALGGGASGGSSSGVTGDLVVGSPVSSGQQLLTVTDTNGLALTAQVDETDVLLVKPGVRAEVDLDAVPGATYAATVRSVEVSPQSSTAGSVSYVVRLDLGAGTGSDGEAAPTPRPGMSAVVDLSVRTAMDVVAVPASAVFRDGQRDVIWAVSGGGAVKRPVTVGAQGTDLVEIRRGVGTGTRVVVAGADRVRAGQQLK